MMVRAIAGGCQKIPMAPSRRSLVRGPMARKKTKLARAGAALMAADKATHDALKPYRRTAAVRTLTLAAKVGDQPPLLAISGGLLALGLVRGDGRMARAGARMIAGHLLATAAKNFVKHRVDRNRPRSADGPQDHKVKPGRSKAKEKTSFPSGHSAGAIAVARAFARDYPEHGAPALAAGLLIALAQIPRAAHYPSDVAAGLAIGLAAEAAVGALWAETGA
jgi:membrane-associated phospholipid phosphatase